MNGVRTSCTERILTAIEYGNLTNEETERRIVELIEAEVGKTDSAADMELIDACQSLLWQLHSHGTVAYDSHAEQNHEKLMARIAKTEKRRSIDLRPLRWVAVAAVVILLFVGVRFSWFEHSDTPDGQQHVITGQEITVEMVQAAIAENTGKDAVETTDLQELRDIIGFDPHIPETIADEWHVSACAAWFARNCVQVTVTYENRYVPDDTLIYVINFYSSVSDSYLTFEQSDKGEDTLVGEQQVYLSVNVERSIACWCKDNMICEVSCRMKEDSFRNLVRIIVEGGT